MEEWYRSEEGEEGGAGEKGRGRGNRAPPARKLIDTIN